MSLIVNIVVLILNVSKFSSLFVICHFVCYHACLINGHQPLAYTCSETRTGRSFHIDWSPRVIGINLETTDSSSQAEVLGLYVHLLAPCVWTQPQMSLFRIRSMKWKGKPVTLSWTFRKNNHPILLNHLPLPKHNSRFWIRDGRCFEVEVTGTFQWAILKLYIIF